MTAFTTSRAFTILNQGGNSRRGMLGKYVDLYCPPAGAVTDTRTIRFAADTGGYEIPRMKFAGSFNTAAVITANIATISYYLNGALVVGTVSFARGDSLLVRATRQSPFPATAVISFEYASSSTGVNSSPYLWEIWENLQNAADIPDEYEETRGGLLLDSPSNGYDKGANGAYRATGACRMEFRNTGNRFVGGLSNESTITYPATLWNRIRHAWVVVGAAATCRTLGAVEAGAITLSGVSPWYRFAVEDTGAAVIYQYSADNGATWVTHYTSSLAYVPNTVWHTDICGYDRYTYFKGVKLYGGNIA